MDINILINFGNDYKVSLSTHDARYLFDQLKEMFEPSVKVLPSISFPTTATTVTSPYTYGVSDAHVCCGPELAPCWCKDNKAEGNA